MSNLHRSSIEEIKQLQWLQLKKQLIYLDLHSPFYQDKFRKSVTDVTKILSYDDFRHLPITTKEDLQEHNEDFICVPREEIIDHVTTSGTLGIPVSLGLNEADLQRLTRNELESFKLIGVEKGDVVQITTTLDRRFMAGLAYFMGLRELGAGIVRTGSGLPQLQWDSIERFRPKYIVAVPSFLVKMLQYAKDNNIDISETSVKAAICIGEPIRELDYSLNTLGKRITEDWNIDLFSTYASTEMATAFTECEVHMGNHSQPDLIFTEILDDDGRHVKPGEIGELVITTLQNETMPLLRFATGDMLTFTDSPCTCGRNTQRLSSVMGRKQQMIKLKGTSIYPQNIIEILTNFKGLDTFVIEARRNDLEMDMITVKVPDNVSLERIDTLTEIFKSRLQVTPDIELVKKEEIELLRSPEEKRKPEVFRDLR
ncbi:phenylacetate--CoA ligase [Antarcticibacterium flavum]|uniref:Phenylacetate--CoA ligase n=1 Tax=Antarcticibacterium flavum TaxID=2058175 RepID=A0A5B7X0A4_9FLAO|nr:MULTISPECIES: AMP-binding protein [Antarcticibacterium]MCM4158834.1 phenylacetate--CoA ligase [Antarcticibacterium sp. W02-3]QCY68098.1 phenylacetate--CoA ligase [Antarcticibacterium flavum]